jgi:hypothetical protein
MTCGAQRRLPRPGTSRLRNDKKPTAATLAFRPKELARYPWVKPPGGGAASPLPRRVRRGNATVREWELTDVAVTSADPRVRGPGVAIPTVPFDITIIKLPLLSSAPPVIAEHRDKGALCMGWVILRRPDTVAVFAIERALRGYGGSSPPEDYCANRPPGGMVAATAYRLRARRWGS